MVVVSSLVREVYILFAGWEFRIAKNRNRDLQNAYEGSFFKTSCTVFR